MNGWYRQQRNLSERAWFKDALMVQLYCYLKERAYVQDGKYEGQRICRGSCPITRSEMLEATGLRYATLDRKLKKLVSYGEIIVRANNHFSVVTICDYDSCGRFESLFDTASDTTGDTASDTTNDTTGDTTHLLTKEGIRNKEYNLISLSSYKKERESLEDAYKIKDMYNKTFDGKLPPCLRLQLPTKVMVMECVRRFGAQSVGIVFEQVLNEPFSLGSNNTGFRASFQFIFTPKNFQGYLERAQLRGRKQQPQPQQKQKKVGVIELEPQHQEVSKEEKERRHYLEMVPVANENRLSHCYMILVQAYERGDLERLGIDWKPNKD